MSEGNTISASDYQRAVAEATRRKERIRALEARVAELEGANADLNKALDEVAEEYKAVEAEAADWKQKYESSPDEWRAKYEDAQKQLRERDIRSLFDKHAGKLVREDAAEAAWKLAGLAPDDAGDPDDEAIGKRVAELVSANPFLAKPEPAVSGGRGADASGRPHAIQSQPGPGAVRGSVNTPHATGSTTGGAAQAATYLEKTGRSSTPYRIA